MTELNLCLFGYFLFELFESSNAGNHITEIFLSQCWLDIFIWKNLFLLLEFFRFPKPVSLWVVIRIFLIVFNVHIVVNWWWLFWYFFLFLRFYELIILPLSFFEYSLLTLICYLRLNFLYDFFNIFRLINTLVILDLKLFNRSLSAYSLECFDD